MLRFLFSKAFFTIIAQTTCLCDQAGSQHQEFSNFEQKEIDLMSTDIQVNRPEPISSDIKTGIFDHETDVQKTIEDLLEGKRILIEGVYSNGLTLSHKLNLFLQKKYPNESFQEQRKFRSEYRRLSQLILMQVKDYSVLHLVQRTKNIGIARGF